VPPLHDVLVIGGGNAALCAAIEAARAGASVLMLEAAPEHLRGGNSRHVRNVRYLHNRAEHFLSGAYTEDEIWQDLLQVTGGNTDEQLARLTIRDSADLGSWILANGGRWQGALRGTLQLSRTNAFFLGGGKALINAYYQSAQRLGVEVRYEAEACDVRPGNDGFPSVLVASGETNKTYAAKAIIVASGGLEANLAWLAQHWGEAAQNFAVRGTPFNRGRPLLALIDHGAATTGDPREFHAVAVDARGPQFDGGIVTRLDTVPFGIVVNQDGQRFADEGADLWPKRYASWGGLIARQAGQTAYSLLDAKMRDEFMASAYEPIEAGSLPELARALALDAEALMRTVAAFNAAVQEGTYDASTLDGCHTAGLEPPKSHWARRLDTPPFLAYPLRAGITFTYHCLKVNERAQVLSTDGAPLPGVYAAGEAMAGNVLGRGYLAGFGVTIGTVFGRIAGREAAKHALA
jgi:tricarballylate dehydrogenase